ncbi:hypothetical protein [Dyella silvatica]|uniref:hypothetical protein n=1 Tax=Dyella silvatica TaxID=2992128 RepID=UPI0022593229|nr:hypothetical protein [Dyella silvatica]
MSLQQHGSEMFFTAREGHALYSAKLIQTHNSRLAIAHVTVAFFSQYLGVDMEGSAFALAYAMALLSRHFFNLFFIARNVTRTFPLWRAGDGWHGHPGVTDIQHARVAGVRRLRGSRSS